ncbi:hypothetical protein Tco_0001690 [Tanacetum coccineum]
MKFENTQNNALAKLPMLKLREYEMWEIRIKQYFQIQDYALWEVIENGNSWVPIPVTTPPEETGTSTTTKMTSPATIEKRHVKRMISIRELEGKSSLMEAILLEMGYQGYSSTKAAMIEDALKGQWCAIDGAGFDGVTWQRIIARFRKHGSHGSF